MPEENSQNWQIDILTAIARNVLQISE